MSIDPTREPQKPAPPSQLDPRIVLAIAVALASGTGLLADWEHAVMVFACVVELFRGQRGDT
ncbi:hypothetical protein [Mycobacterium sp. SMC-4]|uniref:hypothetical protein n=1 Tax=Mycobacterium sp. SMC-4 TaxID=2857059 RepID=UPI0021B35B15|nr:hypothetical protein [Mycobacterium sp. SMC-4]UXA17653.1 hypothetical protein KXD98_23580 [Mycobacterium sp. SMC-4]